MTEELIQSDSLNRFLESRAPRLKSAPGDFASLQTVDEVLNAVRSELGDAVAEALTAATAQESEPAKNSAPRTERL
jgi:flagellar basal body P-ring protein FlgI